jgi:hypothetical protein
MMIIEVDCTRGRPEAPAPGTEPCLVVAQIYKGWWRVDAWTGIRLLPADLNLRRRADALRTARRLARSHSSGSDLAELLRRYGGQS